MAYASGGGKAVKTSGTVGGDGAISTHVTAIAAGSNVTLTSSGSVVTIASSSGSGGNTLDGAYDEGGSGAGRTITVDNGGVVLAGTGVIAGVLEVTTNHNDAVPLKAFNGANGIMQLQSVTAGSQLGLRGPIQSVYRAPGQITAPDPTAVDLQFTAGSHLQTAKGIDSLLVGGQNNQIGVDTAVSETSNQTGASAGSNSFRGTTSSIVGGANNSIEAQTVGVAADQACIVGSINSHIKDDTTARASIGFNVTPSRSAVFGGNANFIINGEDSSIIGGKQNTVQNATFGLVVSGENNTINSASSAAGPGKMLSIIGSSSSSISTKLAAPINTADEPSNYGQNISVIASHGAAVTQDPRRCLLVGDAPIATKDTSNNFRDASCVIVGGGGTDTNDTHTNSNAIALVGNSYHTVGAALGKGYADISWETTGADFAEYFEWNDGNPNGEDRVGLFVKLSTNDSGVPNGKIEISGENTIGPVSAMPGFVSNATPLNWAGKWQKDDFGRFVFDDDGNRIANPDFDADAGYTAREAREEWSPIGMVGRLRVRASTNIGMYPSSKSGLTVNIANDGTVVDAGAKGKYKVIQVVKQKEIWSGPEGVFRRRRQIQDHGYGIVEILVV